VSFTLMRTARLLAGILLLCGCATPVVFHPNVKRIEHDKNTEYTLVERPNGFELAVYYETYQFIPSPGAVAEVCRSTGTSLAHTLAEPKRVR
jgi:hypothetical protein